MRSENKLEGREVLCIWLREAAEHLSVTPVVFSTSVRKSGLGKTQDKREFLLATSTDNYIKKSNCCSRVVCQYFLISCQ